MKRKKVILFMSSMMLVLFMLSDLSFAQGACDFIGRFRTQPNFSELKSLRAEHSSGKLCNPKYASVCVEGDVPLSTVFEMGISKDDETLKELLKAGFNIWISTVDIDNDGVDEIRLFSTVGSRRCTRSYFYKRDKSGRFQPMADKGYSVLSEEGRFCDGNITFIRFQGKVFVLEVYDTIDTVWLGSERGLQQQCTFNTP